MLLMMLLHALEAACRAVATGSRSLLMLPMVGGAYGGNETRGAAVPSTPAGALGAPAGAPPPLEIVLDRVAAAQVGAGYDAPPGAVNGGGAGGGREGPLGRAWRRGLCGGAREGSAGLGRVARRDARCCTAWVATVVHGAVIARDIRPGVGARRWRAVFAACFFYSWSFAPRGLW